MPQQPTATRTTHRRQASGRTIIRHAHAGPQPGAEKRKYVRLEFLRMQLEPDLVLASNAGWDIYFVLQVEHPKKPSKLVAISFPRAPINFTKEDENAHVFGHKEGEQIEGQEIYFGPMPADNRITVQINAIQSKEKARNTGAGLRRISTFVQEDVVESLELQKAPNPWVQGAVIANKAAGLIGSLMEKTGDKDRGMATLDEEFDDREFKTRGHKNRKANFSGHDVKLLYRWTIVEM